MTTTRAGKNTENADAHPIEWAVGLTSCLLVSALIAIIAWQALTYEPQRPELATHVTNVTPVTDGYRVDFEVTNSANSTAAAAVVTGTLTREDGTEAERQDVTFDYVPALSSATGALIFAADPRQGRLALRATGFADP